MKKCHGGTFFIFLNISKNNASIKSIGIYSAAENLLKTIPNNTIKTIVFNRGKEFSNNRK